VVSRDRPTELRECLLAIRSQDYLGPIEVIVVHDRSPVDESLADNSPDRSVRVMANQRTAGLAGGRNTGLLAARGDIVAFCDDDDLWLPAKLRLQTELLARTAGAEMATCGIRIAYGPRRIDRVPAADRVDFADLLASRLTELHPSTFCMRRSALIGGMGLVDETLQGSYAEDYELLLRAAKRASVIVVREVLVEVRWHPKSYFATEWPTISAALRQLLEAYPEFDGVPKGAARVLGQIAFAEAARGNRTSAVSWAGRALRRNLAEPRGYLALAVAVGLIRPATVMRQLNSRGRGI
ncbi:MAG: glycosyltransferase family A protein, partial [Acidimicrobiales bacterium]